MMSRGFIVAASIAIKEPSSDFATDVHVEDLGKNDPSDDDLGIIQIWFVEKDVYVTFTEDEAAKFVEAFEEIRNRYQRSEIAAAEVQS